MNQQRRTLIGMLGAAAVAVTVPFSTKSAALENTFCQEDTPEERLDKFNELTGLSLAFGPHWLTKHGRFGERCLMDGKSHFTGSMNKETFMRWTVQVALGYRIAKAQGDRS